MTEAKQRESWNHTAAAMALVANVHRDPKKQRVFKPADFHPLPERRTPARLPGGLLALVWGLVQLGDRLWRRRNGESAHALQSVECRFEHAAIADSLRGLHEAQRDLLRAHADMLRTVQDTQRLTVEQTQRHHEVLESLRRIERLLQIEDPRIVT